MRETRRNSRPENLEQSDQYISGPADLLVRIPPNTRASTAAPVGALFLCPFILYNMNCYGFQSISANSTVSGGSMAGTDQPGYILSRRWIWQTGRLPDRGARTGTRPENRTRRRPSGQTKQEKITEAGDVRPRSFICRRFHGDFVAILRR